MPEISCIANDADDLRPLRMGPILGTYVRFGLPIRVNVVIAEDVQIRSLSHKKEGRVGSVIRQTSAVEFVVPRLVTVDAHLVRGYHLITHEYVY